MGTQVAVATPQRALRVGGRAYPVILPSLGDPRLQLAAVITTLQVLGQTVLHFDVSVAQILVSVGTCALIEAGWTFATRRVLMWPASALLTGNSVAFILRSTQTRWGQWWSLGGIHIFVLAGALSLLSKYLLRRRGAHVFNPSNLGLVAAFTLFGTSQANPQDLWWGPLSPGLLATLAVIVLGGLLIVRRLRMLGMVAAFWLTFAALTGVLSASGHCFTARWHYGAVCGGDAWSALVASPEILVFVFFMITDPRTAPRGSLARLLYGGCIGLLAALLVAPMRTEFGTKVAVLDALVLTCGLMPLANSLLPVRATPALLLRRGILPPLAALAAACGLVVALGIPARSAGAGPAAPLLQPGFAAAAARLDPPLSALPPLTITADAASHVSETQARAMLRDLIGDLRAAGRPAQIAGATVVLARDPSNQQAAPQLAVEAAGSDYVLTRAGGRWVIAATYPSPG